MSFKVIDELRVTRGPMKSDPSYGNNGCFMVPTRPGKPPLLVVASDRGGWEHVSVSRPDRIPSWDDMCRIKGLFWDDDDCVMQLHPPRSDWVNNHSRCLHLWRPVGVEIPRPPSIMVGDARIGVLT